MKGSRYPRHWRKAAPLLLLALGACTSTPPASQPPLLVDSELGMPLGSTQRSGDALLDRQRAQASSERKPPVRHQVDLTSRARAPRSDAPASNPLGDQPVTLNFVEADIQAVVRALSRSTGQQFLVDPRVKGNLTLVSEGQVPARQAVLLLGAARRVGGHGGGVYASPCWPPLGRRERGAGKSDRRLGGRACRAHRACAAWGQLPAHRICGRPCPCLQWRI